MLTIKTSRLETLSRTHVPQLGWEVVWTYRGTVTSSAIFEIKTTTLTHYDRNSFLRLNLNQKNKNKNVKMNILTSILSSKYFSQIRGSQTFPRQGPPKLYVFGRRPPSRKRPETEISVTKVSFEEYIFKDLNKCSRFYYFKIADLAFRRHS